MVKKVKEEILFIDKFKILTEDGIDLDKRIIFVFGELNDDLGTILRVKYASIKLYWEEELGKQFSDITIDISSQGGSIYSINAALDFYEELKSENILVNTVAKGICMSAATIILSGGTGIRAATKRCRFMLHDIQTTDVNGTATQITQFAKDFKKEQDAFFKFYAEHTMPKTQPYTEIELRKEIRKWKKRFADNSIDHYISAQEALKLRLIDKIL